jgi:hypothetical protein
MGERGRFFPNVRAGLSGELFHERRERDSPAELRTLRSSDSLATTVEGRPNVESKQQMVKMSGSTYREVQSARGKPSMWKCAFGQAARAFGPRDTLGNGVLQAAGPALQPACELSSGREFSALLGVARASRRQNKSCCVGDPGLRR